MSMVVFVSEVYWVCFVLGESFGRLMVSLKFYDFCVVYRFWFGCLGDFVCWCNDGFYGVFDLDVVVLSSMVFVSWVWFEVWMGVVSM